MADVTLEQLDSRLEIIRNSLRWALWAHSLWFAGAPDTELMGRLGASQAIHPVGRAQSVLLHQGAVLALMRVWDGNEQSGSLPALAADLRRVAKDREFFEAMVNDRGDAGARLFAKEAGRLAQHIESEAGSIEQKALRRLRNEFLAHSQHGEAVTDTRWAEPGDERKLLERTVPLADELYLLFNRSWNTGFNLPLVEEHMTCKAISPLLWAGVRRESEDERLAYYTRLYDLKHPAENQGADHVED